MLENAALQPRSLGSPMPRLGRGRSITRSSAAMPSRSTTTRSASATASATSWVMSTVVNPCSRQIRASNSCISERVSASSAPNGSSSSRTPGRLTKARASATRCFCPPESIDGQSLARSARPTSASAAVAVSRQPGSRAIPTLPTTRCQRSSRESWKSRRTERCRPMTGAPAIRTSPCVGFSRPAISRRSVVLPPPERPTTARNCPAGIERSSACSTGRAPKLLATRSRATGCPSFSPKFA